MTQENWLTTIDGNTLLAIYDVVLDIEQEINIASDRPAIPLFRNVIRFPQLCPGDSAGTRDRYCELRWKAAAFLKKIGTIHSFEYDEADHRWESHIIIDPDEPAVRNLAKQLAAEYERRASRKKPSQTINSKDSVSLVRDLLHRFHRLATEQRRRHDERPALEIQDEYDVQDLLRAVLVMHFADVRPEEWTPSYAGKSARADLFLKPEEIVIEVKKTRTNLTEKQIGDQLIVDVQRYKKMPGCKQLLCFVYDPEERIRNPRGLEADLSSKEENFAVEVIVSPRR